MSGFLGDYRTPNRGYFFCLFRTSTLVLFH